MDSPVPTDPVALATPADFVQRFTEYSKSFDEIVIAESLVEATDYIETLVNRRLAPFTSIVYEDRLYGIDPVEYGGNSIAGMPMPWQGSLGVSYANALGANDLVRHFWLDHFAPFHPELWTYNIESIVLDLTFGNSMIVEPNSLIGGGPAKSDGHCFLQLGTFSPIGTRITVTYSGGYTVSIPPALKRACLYQAMKFCMLDSAPSGLKGVSTDEIDTMTATILSPWARG